MDDALVPTSDNADAVGSAHPTEDTLPADPDLDSGSAAERSLSDDIEALLTNARSYVDAELTYQKSRAGFVANRVKVMVVCGLVAVFLAVLALIGLTMGLIIALSPVITAWGATAVVVLGILLIASLLVLRAAKAWKDLTGVMSPPVEEPADDA